MRYQIVVTSLELNAFENAAHTGCRYPYHNERVNPKRYFLIPRNEGYRTLATSG